MPGDPDRSQAEFDQRHRRSDRPVHPARRAGPYTVRQRPGIYRHSGSGMDRCRRREDSVHSSPAAHGRTAIARASMPGILSPAARDCASTSGRTPERRDLLLAGRGQGRDRKLASSLQHRTPTLFAGLPPAGTAGRAMAGCAIRTGFTGHASLGAKANYAQRFALDHSKGADQILLKSQPQFWAIGADGGHPLPRFQGHITFILRYAACQSSTNFGPSTFIAQSSN